MVARVKEDDAVPSTQLVEVSMSWVDDATHATTVETVPRSSPSISRSQKTRHTVSPKRHQRLQMTAR